MAEIENKRPQDPRISSPPPTPWQLYIFDLVIWSLSLIFDCFFREIRPRGAFRIPKSGPLIFVAAPHANQFVDPILLIRQVQLESGRRTSFLVAEKSYRQKFIGLLAKLALAIPVTRAQDNLKAGTGRVFLRDPINESCKINGIGTKFTTELMVKGLLGLPKSAGNAEVLEIISDTEVIIRKEFKNPKALDLLTQKGGSSFKKADKVDQSEVYNRVFGHLATDGCLGIFPEGGSHDRTDLLPLKAGVAIMALGAMAEYPNCDVKIIPCGMNYFHPNKFRSRAVIEFGHPITIPKDVVQKYKNGNHREAVKVLLDQVTDGLKAVTVTCPDFETLMVIQAARRLHPRAQSKVPLPLIIEFNRRLVIGYNTFKENPKIQHLKEAVLEYNQQLKNVGLPDHQVEVTNSTEFHVVFGKLIFRSVKLLLLIIGSLPGTLLFAPVFFATKRISQKKAAQALAGSTVKIKANDVVATWKILVGMGLTPMLYLFYSILSTYISWKYNLINIKLPINKILLTFIGSFILFSSLSFAALRTGEIGMDIFKSLRPLYLSLVGDQISLKQLKTKRRELSQEVTEIVHEFGPKLFKDFDKWKIIKQGHTDEEEENITQRARQRREERRKAAKLAQLQESSSSTDVEDETRNRSSSDVSSTTANTETDNEEFINIRRHDSTTSITSSESNAISRMNSQNSLSNIPLFNEYQLSENGPSGAISTHFEGSSPELLKQNGMYSSGVAFHNDLSQRIRGAMAEKQRSKKIYIEGDSDEEEEDSD